MEPDRPLPPEPAPLTVAEALARYMDAVPAWTPPRAPAPGAAGGPDGAPVLHLSQLAALPAPSWLIGDILPDNGLACVYGPPGAGKTFLALDWALSTATGRPWASHATRAGAVLYIAAEGRSGLLGRVTAWEGQHGPAQDCAFYLLLDRANLLDEDTPGAVLAKLALAGGVATDLALIVVDTLARCMAGGDENSARDMGRAIAGADQLRQATGAAVVLVHHTVKNGTGERGSGALRGACDMMVSVSADDGTVTLECDKMKDAAPFPRERWILEERDGSCVLLPSSAVALARPDRPLSSPQRRVLEALAGPVLGGKAAAGDIRAATNLAESTLFRTLASLIARGLVQPGPGTPKPYCLTEAGAATA